MLKEMKSQLILDGHIKLENIESKNPIIYLKNSKAWCKTILKKDSVTVPSELTYFLCMIWYT